MFLPGDRTIYLRGMNVERHGGAAGSVSRVLDNWVSRVCVELEMFSLCLHVFYTVSPTFKKHVDNGLLLGLIKCALRWTSPGCIHDSRS